MMTGILVPLLAVGAAATAVAIHDFFEGETLIHDVVDELRLSRTSLTELDRAWAQNPRRSEAIVSLMPDARLRVYEGGHLFTAQDRSAMADLRAFLTEGVRP